MTPRERLHRITKEANDKGHVLSCSDNDAAALRELDKLLSDMRLALEIHARDAMSRHPHDVADILDRAAQAGYGEK